MKRTEVLHRVLLVLGVSVVIVSNTAGSCDSTTAKETTVLQTLCSPGANGIDRINGSLRTYVGASIAPQLLGYTGSCRPGTTDYNGYSVTLTSSNPSVVRPNASVMTVGQERWTAVGVGQATITATAKGVATLNGAPVVWQKDVIVVPGQPLGIAVTPASSITLAPNASTNLTATLITDQGAALNQYDFDWSCVASGDRVVTFGNTTPDTQCGSSVPSVAGAPIVVKAGAASGTTTLRVTLDQPQAVGSALANLSQDVTIRVGTGAVPARVSLFPASTEIIAGGTRQLTASVFDAGGNELPNASVTWLTRNTSIATVSASGLVTAVSTGTPTTTPSAVVQITARAADGVEAVSNVTVYRPVSDVAVALREATLAPNRTTVAQVTLRDDAGNVIPLSATTITWSSNDPAIATVDQSGNVTTLAAGTARIVATTREGANGRATLTVTSPPAPTIIVTPTSATIQQGQSVTLTAAVLNANGAIDVGWTPATSPYVRVTKSTFNPAMATVEGLLPTPAGTPVSVFATYAQGGTTVTAESKITVVAAPAAGYSVGPASVSVVQGVPTTTAFTPVTLPVTRAGGFTGALGVVVTAPAGLTVVPAATSFAGDVTLRVIAATAAPGTYPVTVRTIATGLADQTTTVNVTVTAPQPSVGLTLVPTSVTVTQGSSATVTANVARSGGFTGPVAIAASGPSGAALPAGLAITPASTSVAGSTVTLTVAAGANLAAGSYTVVVTPNGGAGVAASPATLTVTVTAGAGPAVRMLIEPWDLEVTIPAKVQYQTFLLDAQANPVALGTGDAVTYTLSQGTQSNASITASGLLTALAPAPKGTLVVNARYERNGAPLNSISVPAIIYPATTSGDYSSVEISLGKATRVLKVGEDVYFQVIVKGANGVALTSGVRNLDVTWSDHSAIDVTRDLTDPTPGYFYRIHARAATPKPTALNQFADVVLITAEVDGAKWVTPIIVVP